MSLTPAQMIVAAEMCEARKSQISAQSTEDEVAAAAFIFDNGIFFLGADGCDKIAATLRETAALNPELVRPAHGRKSDE